MNLRNQKPVVLRNMILPIWLLWIFPSTWLIIFPANLVLDFLVTFLALYFLHIPNRKQVLKRSFLKIWLLGFFADFIGALGLIATIFLSFSGDSPFVKWLSDFSSAVAFNPFQMFSSCLWVAFCVLISGFFIFLFNYKISFRRTDLDSSTKKKMSLILAVFTAPYLYFLPTVWFVS